MNIINIKTSCLSTRGISKLGKIFVNWATNFIRIINNDIVSALMNFNFFSKKPTLSNIDPIIKMNKRRSIKKLYHLKPVVSGNKTSAIKSIMMYRM